MRYDYKGFAFTIPIRRKGTMNMLLTILQAAEGASKDMKWNYIVLAVLIVLAVILIMSVMRKRKKDV